ncbi:uncharacterized protein [Dermacentor albipictus]|uniref:uncharacterized protein isoform X2 n=1 Tax=Dermacentor albipictus TaxID=60249 RepID=UPI0031FDD760
MSSTGTTGTTGRSGERTEKAVGSVDKHCHANDCEDDEEAVDGVPSTKRRKQATSFAAMECYNNAEDEEYFDDDEDEEDEGEIDDDDDDDYDSDSSAHLQIVDAEEEDDQVQIKGQGRSNASTSRKNCSRAQSGSSCKVHAEDLRLEDYVPDHYIDSYEKRDSCSLAITVTHSARSVDITELSGDIIKLVFKGNRRKAFVRYTNPETAAANLKIIEKAVGNGKVVRVERCTTGQQTPLGNLLDLFRLPFNCTVARLKQQFPCSRVQVLKHGFARLCFNSTDDLKRALQRPGCHTIDGHPILLSLVKDFQEDTHYPGRHSWYSRGVSDSTSRGGRGWGKNSQPGERAYWRGSGGRGGHSSRMGSRPSDWDGRGDWGALDDRHNQAWSGGSRSFWNSSSGGRRGMRGGRRGSWSRT